MNQTENHTQCLDNRKKSKWTFKLLFAVLVIAMSSIQYGYAIGVVNAPEMILRHWYNETHVAKTGTSLTDKKVIALWSINVAIFCIGGLFGGFFGGIIAQQFGRKACLLQNNVVTLIATVFMGCSKLASSYSMLILGRLLIGFNSGIATVVVPMYLAEIAPVDLRGSTGTVNQLAIVLSMLAAQILGIPQILGTPYSWPILFSLNAIPCLVQSVLLILIPESPRYLLLTKDDPTDAKKALIKLRGHNSCVESELKQMHKEVSEEKRLPPTTWMDMVKFSVFRKPLIVASECHMAQQLSGINAVLFFSTGIFMQAGLNHSSAIYATVGMGGISVLVTLVSMAIIERVGRRFLFISGLIGMWACTILLTVTLKLSAQVHWAALLSILIVMVYVVSAGIGPNVIAWFVSAELFTQSPRTKAMGISVIFNWLSNFLVGLLFPLFFELLKNYVFLIFTVLISFFIIFTYKYLPETKGKSSEEIIQFFMTPEEKNCPLITNKVFGKSPLSLRKSNEERLNTRQSNNPLQTSSNNDDKDFKQNVLSTIDIIR